MKGFFISIPNYGSLFSGRMTVWKLVKILRRRFFTKDYVMLYMGVDEEHHGLGKALAEAVMREYVRVPYADQGLNRIRDGISDEAALFVGDILAAGYRGKIDTTPLIAHTFLLREIEKAYDIFENRKEHVLKIAIKP